MALITRQRASRTWVVVIALSLTAGIAALPTSRATPRGAQTMLGEVTCRSVDNLLPHARASCGALSSYRGWVVWTSYDPVAGGFVMVAAAGGITRQLPVTPSRRIFDVDVGPDESGRPTAVFSQCAKHKCAVRSLDLESERVTRLRHARAGAQLMPSRWRNRLAIVRRTRTGRRRIEICRVTGRVVGRCHVVHGLPGGAAATNAWTGPTGIDLSGRWLAIAWRWRPKGGDPSEQNTAILLRRNGSVNQLRTVARARGVPDVISAVHTPVLAGGSLYYVDGDAGCGDIAGNVIVRYDPVRRVYERHRAPDLSGLTIDNAARIEVRCDEFVDHDAVTSAPVLRDD